VSAKSLVSRKAPQDAVGEPVDLFAYPHGDHDAAVRDRVIAAGYRGATQAVPNPHEIPRQDISHGDSLAGYFCKLTFKNRLKERHG
jgi:hypothetical protein